MHRHITRLALVLPSILILAVVIRSQTALANAGNPGESMLRTVLTGPAIKGVRPVGESEYDSYTNRSGRTIAALEVETLNVNLTNGSVLTVKLNGTTVGNMTVRNRKAAILFSSDRGVKIPPAAPGDRISLYDSTGKAILSGTY